MTQRLHLALLSFAHEHAHHWARSLCRSKEAELIAVWDDDEIRGRAAAATYGVEFEADLTRLLARADLDAVGICSETDRHAPLTIAAARAGKHVLCEKPMATSLTDCDAMIAACQSSGVHYMQAFPQRHDPANLQIERLLEEGSIGRVLNLRRRHGHGGLLLGWFDPPDMKWFLDPVRAGGGAFLDEGIHAADTLRWFLGDPLRVTARMQCTMPGLPVEDNGVAIYDFPGDVRAVLEASWTWLAATLTMEIYGSEGTILQQGNDCASTEGVSEIMPRLMVHSRKHALPGWYLDTTGATYFKGAHEEVARAFVCSLQAGVPPPVSGRDGRQALAMVLGAYESHRTGRTVELKSQETGARG